MRVLQFDVHGKVVWSRTITDPSQLESVANARAEQLVAYENQRILRTTRRTIVLTSFRIVMSDKPQQPKLF